MSNKTYFTISILEVKYLPKKRIVIGFLVIWLTNYLFRFVEDLDCFFDLWLVGFFLLYETFFFVVGFFVFIPKKSKSLLFLYGADLVDSGTIVRMAFGFFGDFTLL